jgi:hypothetical protein
MVDGRGQIGDNGKLLSSLIRQPSFGFHRWDGARKSFVFGLGFARNIQV